MNLERLKTKIPEAVMSQIPDVVEKFKIDTPLRLAHFLAQCAHESGNFKFTTENLNYSKEGLMKVFARYFPNETIAKQYEKKPNAIANKVYANRMGNGDENSGDGSKFKGRGYLQITGKNNYKALSDDVGVDFIENPDLVATKYPLLSAAWFFKKNNLFEICDLGVSRANVERLTKRINGGLIGIEDRWAHFNEYNKILSDI